MTIRTTIEATHVATKATRFDSIPVRGSRRQIRAIARKLAKEPGRANVWLGWNWDKLGGKPLSFKSGKQIFRRPNHEYESR